MLNTRRLLVGSFATMFLLARATGAQDGITNVPPTTYTGTTPVYWQPPGGQHVIPRYANGVTHPAGQLIGSGPTSCVQATSETASQTPPAVVVTEDFQEDNARYQQASGTTQEAILQPVVRDISILGRDIGGDDYASSVSGVPNNNPGFAANGGSVSGATNATPIVITTSGAHSLSDGHVVAIINVQGNTAANGMWAVNVLTGTTFELTGSVGNGTYTSGTGSWGSRTGSSGTITDVDESVSPMVITSAGHGLYEHAVIRIVGAGGTTPVNRWWSIRNVTTDTFELEASFGSGAYTSGGTWACWANTSTDEDQYNGYSCDAVGSKIQDVNAFAIPGTCFHIQRTGGGTHAGGVQPFDATKGHIHGGNVTRSYRGYNINVIDQAVGHLEGSGLRDYGIKFSSGACQIDESLHFFGVYPGAAIWIQGSNNWGGPMYPESSMINLQVDGNHNLLESIYTHSAYKCAIQNSGTHNSFDQFEVTYINSNETPVGIEQAGANATYSNGYVESPDGCLGMHLTSGNGVRMNNVDFTGLGSNSVGIYCAAELTGCHWDVRLGGSGIGVRLKNAAGTSTIGLRNVLHFQSAGGAALTKYLDLPTTAIDPTTKIYFNGARVKAVISNTTNGTGADTIRVTSNSHGLVDGDVIWIRDCQGNTAANNNDWFVDVIDANSFDIYSNAALTTDVLQNGTYTANSGWWGVTEP